MHILHNCGTQNKGLYEANDRLKKENEKLQKEQEQYNKMIGQIKSATSKLSSAQGQASSAQSSYNSGYSGGGSSSDKIKFNISLAVSSIGSLISELNGTIPSAEAKIKQKRDKRDKNNKIIGENIAIIKRNDLSIKGAQNEIAFLQSSL